MPPVIALVPMRHYSARVTGKNYRPLGGRPLYHHIVERLLACPHITEVLIDTDSDFILSDAPRAFPERLRVIRRAEHLLGETAPFNEILLYDVRQTDADLFLQTHSTNPLLRTETITRALETYVAARDKHDSLFSVTARQVRFYWPDGRPVNHDPAELLRTQDLAPIYEENSCLYVFERATIERRHNRLGERPLMFPIEGAEASDIDDEHDWQLVEALYELTTARR